MTPYPLVPVCNLLCGFAVFLLLPWKIRSNSVGICSYIIWVSSLCFICAINAIIWKNHSLDVAPVWCDISKSPYTIPFFVSSLLILSHTSNPDNFWWIHCIASMYCGNNSAFVPFDMYKCNCYGAKSKRLTIPSHT